MATSRYPLTKNLQLFNNSIVDQDGESEISTRILSNLLNNYKDFNIIYPKVPYMTKDKTDSSKNARVSLEIGLVKFQRNKDKNQSRYAVYQNENELGHGNQGKVYLCKHTLTFNNSDIIIKQKSAGKYRVVKIGNIGDIQSITASCTRYNFHQEYLIMSTMQNIFHAKEHIIEAIVKEYALISRYFNGVTLDQALFGNDPIKFDFEKRLELCAVLAEKVKEMHEYKIIHRDLKTENILVNDSANNKYSIDAHIIDFGFAISIDDAKIDGGASPGTPLYAPPETWRGLHSTVKSDVFSLGRIFWLILSNKKINRFIYTQEDAQNARMPLFVELFSHISILTPRPNFLNLLYSLLLGMNYISADYRYSLNDVIQILADIRCEAKEHFDEIKAASIKTTGTDAAAAVASNSSGLGLFSSANPPKLPHTSEPEKEAIQTLSL